MVYVQYAHEIDPTWGHNIAKLQEKAAYDASNMASSHYPYAVIEATDGLRSYAGQRCEDMWQGLKNREKYQAQYDEVKRIYVATFVGRYREAVEKRKQADLAKEAASRQQAEKEKGAMVEIKSRKRLPDGVLYMVKFFDPGRMTQAVSFGVSVKDDGVVELEEL